MKSSNQRDIFYNNLVIQIEFPLDDPRAVRILKTYHPKILDFALVNVSCLIARCPEIYAYLVGCGNENLFSTVD